MSDGSKVADAAKIERSGADALGVSPDILLCASDGPVGNDAQTP
jgi:hypothetical protein